MSLLTFSLLIHIPKSRAELIPINEMKLALESYIVDMEFGFLVSYVGKCSNKINYFSKITDSGWDGILSGYYDNKPLFIRYMGNTTDLSNMYWSGEGMWGNEIWSSSGFASFQDPPFEGILDIQELKVGLSLSGSIGVGSITAEIVKDLDDKELTASVEASALDVPVFGSALSAKLTFILNQRDFTYVSNQEIQVLFGLVHQAKVVNKGRIFKRKPGKPPQEIPEIDQNLGDAFEVGFNPNGITFNQMQLQAIPEPKIFLLLMFSFPFIIFYKFVIKR